MSTIDLLEQQGVAQSRTRRGRLRGLSRETKIGAGILAVLFLAGLLAPLIAPYGQNQLNFTDIYSAPSLSHVMGTDGAGRDVFSRTLYALRLDLGIVLLITYPPLVVGVLIGAVGTAAGLAIGHTLCYLADHYRWLKLDEQVYSISYVPFEPRWQDDIWIAGLAMAVSLVATLYPARSATRIAPVEALRYE